MQKNNGKWGDLSDYTLYSGGAYGADTWFGMAAGLFDVKQLHFRPPGNQRLSKNLRENGVKPTVLTLAEMEEGYNHLEDLLGKKLERGIGNDLKARNFFQAWGAEAIFAVAKLAQGGKNKVEGGTDVAVRFGIVQEKPVFVFDMDLFEWFEFNHTTGNFKRFQGIPELPKHFAGVGSRKCQDYHILREGHWVPSPGFIGNESATKVKRAILELFQVANQKKLKNG